MFNLKDIIGIIGLGNMGSIIVERLSNNYEVIGFDIDESSRKKIEEKGLESVSTLEELATKVNRLIISLPNGNISKMVLGNIIPLLKPNTIIIETSTILPKDILSLVDLSKKHKVQLIDSAILGGLTHVQEGNAKLLVGGSDETVKFVEEILLTIGNEIIKTGTLGSGMAAKVINNAVAHNTMVLISEATSVGVKVGISPEKMYDLLNNETTFKRPLDHRYKERVLNGTYEDGMSTLNARKDSMLALELAQQMNVPLFSIQASHTVYDLAVQEGLGHLDYASIATLWEKWCNFSFVSDKE